MRYLFMENMNNNNNNKFEKNKEPKVPNEKSQHYTIKIIVALIVDILVHILNTRMVGILQLIQMAH